MINEYIPVDSVHRHDPRGFFIYRENKDLTMKKRNKPDFP